MNYKSIENFDQVTLLNCEDEAIHIPGSIQQHGFMLAAERETGQIKFCSANVYHFTGFRHEQLLSQHLSQILPAAQYELLADYLKTFNANFSAPLQLQIVENTFNCSIHYSGTYHVLEFEPITTQTIVLSDVYQQTRQFTQFMELAGSLQMLAQMVTDEIRKNTGFDRVMIYRFDDDYNGQVIAESSIEGAEPFLNLNYPASDIPAQARALYLKNLLRIIVDVNYEPVPIFTTADNPEQNLDLTYSILRSVSPIHLQYLRNMQVGASMSVSLVHEKRLWGLIACHHHSPKFISSDLRIAAQLQGHFFTSQITVRQRAEEYQVAQGIEQALLRMQEKLANVEKLSFDELVGNDDILLMTNSSGVVLCVDNVLYTRGDLPSEDDLRKLLNWLNVYSPSTNFPVSNLKSVYPDSASYCSLISGITFHQLGSGNGNCLMWCRKELLEEVRWAGKPNDSKTIGSESALTPRNSFAIWSEPKRCHAVSWQAPELQAATNFAYSLQRHVHMAFLQKEEAKQRQLNTKLTEANAELENLYWIGSHDLKEPLRKIQLFASRIMEEKDTIDYELIVNSVKKMNNSAKRMQLLIADILLYSKLNKTDESFHLQDLNVILGSVLSDLQSEIDEKEAIIQSDNLPAVNGIATFIQQLFTNLLRNSLKFAKENISPFITVKYDGLKLTNNPDEQDRFHRILFIDNGIGFDPQYSESIFKVFTRLHTQTEYPGSGVGLALCRKIMTTHRGYIKAISGSGEGTCIELYFPVIDTA